MRATGVLSPGSPRWRALAFVASLLLLVVLGFFYTNHVQRDSERKWCTLLNLLVAPDQPPQTQRAREIYDAIQAQRRTFGC